MKPKSSSEDTPRPRSDRFVYTKSDDIVVYDETGKKINLNKRVKKHISREKDK